MTPQHTSGPWSLRRTKRGDRARIDGLGWEGLASAWIRLNGEGWDYAEGVANAHLIAAAPDLLDALRDCLPHLPEGELRDRAKYVIDKAMIPLPILGRNEI